MGNDTSRLKGLAIDKNAVEANDFWSLFNAESPTTSNEDGRQLLSIFQGEPVVTGQLWVSQGPMERAIKNLKIYRHPYILKYVTTWEQGGQKHLATERVRPLTAVMATQSDIQVCLGLRTILCSLIFLIEKAMARHLNICSSSIYITDNGSWRLAGFEYVWKGKEVTKTLLDLANAYRCQAAIDPGELKDNHSDTIEQYAFASLCEEILDKCASQCAAPTPHVDAFRNYCATHLKHKCTEMRPKLSAVLLHPYFNHEFVLIHSFLFELPLKCVEERQDFFSGLIDRLRYFSEDVVGSQLAEDLLSRMVLLDPTAQLCVTPYVMRTKTETSAALFSNGTYARHVMPHIMKMFRLRDAQIRLILLEYFMEYVRLMSTDELQECILPHLLAGMNDTNDVLVAKTLRCLADLVPILGSATVIGGQRSRLFSDGRPQAVTHDAQDQLVATTPAWVEPRSITPVLTGSGGGGGVDDDDCMVSGSPLPEMSTHRSSCDSLPTVEDRLPPPIAASDAFRMPPRLSPDGGEDDNKKSATISDVRGGSAPEVAINGIVHEVEEEEEPWSDWETDERLQSTTVRDVETLPPASAVIEEQPPAVPPPGRLRINDDLNDLDIKVQKSATPLRPNATEFDFFKDMEPIIDTKTSGPFSEASPRISPNENGLKKEDEEVLIDTSRFAALDLAAFDGMEDSLELGDGWGMEDNDAVTWST